MSTEEVLAPYCYADYGVRPVGYLENGRFVKVPEMIPQIMVPDLTDFKVSPRFIFSIHQMEQFLGLTFSDIFFCEHCS